MFLTGLAGAGALSLIGCGPEGKGSKPSSGWAPTEPAPKRTGPVKPRVTGTIASGLNVPWGLVFLPDGTALVGQRDAGTIARIDPEAPADNRVQVLGAVPGSAGKPGDSGGLLGMALDPKDDKAVFVFLTTASDMRIVRIEFTGKGLGEIEPIVTGLPKGKGHHGGRIAFGPDGYLYVAVGEGKQGSLAQDKASLGGKILRITRTGKAAPGNPFDSEVWSLGHRNIEGFDFDAAGRLWSSEFGENKADEINLIKKGGNYGWPTVEGASDDPKFVAPKVTWTVAESSPAGLAITQSTAFVAALRGERLWTVPLKGENVGKPTAHFVGKYGRLRTVAVAPDGSLWLGTSNTDGNAKVVRAGDDRLLRVVLD